MTNVLLTISYDGTDFCGWQRQDKADYGNPCRTVQGEIEAVLEKLFKQKINLYGSGRTDSGVHAMGQAANFFSPVDSMEEENYLRALNSLLPKDIRVHSAKKVPESFNSRFSATSRSYRYFIYTDEIPPAKDTRYVWHIMHRPDINVLNQMASLLKGEMDCATFAASGDQSKSTFRYLEKAEFYYDGRDPAMLVFEIEANAFLWKMVRSITGTIISMEKKGLGKAEFERVVKSCDRSKCGFTAPPQGLFLWEVKFDGTRRHV